MYVLYLQALILFIYFLQKKVRCTCVRPCPILGLSSPLFSSRKQGSGGSKGSELQVRLLF
uniref:Uncharacterized protein n=1 Tax=Setaria viridis TaxID=4556 RepID=A0A4U6V2R5_SETVI|nr:hypothetical protein SEVIR_4G207002v2 [Setaria viridis]